MAAAFLAVGGAVYLAIENSNPVITAPPVTGPDAPRESPAIKGKRYALVCQEAVSFGTAGKFNDLDKANRVVYERDIAAIAQTMIEKPTEEIAKAFADGDGVILKPIAYNTSIKQANPSHIDIYRRATVAGMHCPQTAQEGLVFGPWSTEVYRSPDMR